MEDGEGDQAIHVQSSDDEMKDGAAEEEFDPRHSKAFGQPMVCRFEMSKRQITDGFGLCSPGRWVPAAREKLEAKVRPSTPDASGKSLAGSTMKR